MKKIREWFKEKREKSQRRRKGLNIVQRVKWRFRVNIPQFPEDVEWMKTEFEDWLKEFPQYKARGTQR